jgi:uncharacterized protein YeaC (DUF1315 family)
MENWKEVKWYESLYSVSDLGRVKSLEKEVLMKGKFPYIKKEKLLNPFVQKNGYLAVGLTKEGSIKTFKVHQLVAVVFLNHDPSGTKLIVDHINNNKKDNCLQNLQLISQRENSSKDKKGGTSEFVGVCWDKQNKKWRAQIAISGKRIHLGCFNNEIEASEAYQKALNNLV